MDDRPDRGASTKPSDIKTDIAVIQARFSFHFLSVFSRKLAAYLTHHLKSGIQNTVNKRRGFIVSKFFSYFHGLIDNNIFRCFRMK